MRELRAPQPGNDNIVDDRPREIPEDIKNMSKEEIDSEFKKKIS